MVATLPKTREFSDVELLAVGTWHGNGCPDEGCTFTSEDLDGIVAAYEATKDDLHAPVKLGHDDKQPLTDGHPAAGWVENLRHVGTKLVGDLKAVPEAVATAIDAGGYRARSAELMPDMKVGEETYPLVFTGLALLGAHLPAVSGLADITALYNSLHLKLEDGARAIVFALPDGVSYSDLQERLRQALRARFPAGDDYSPWVVDLYDGTVIFCDSESRYWQASYSIDANDDITIGDPGATERVTTWRPAAQTFTGAVDDSALTGEIETFLARLDSRMNGQKGMPAVRAFLRETTSRLRTLRGVEEDQVDEKAVRQALGLDDSADIIEAVNALKAKAGTPSTDVDALKTELSDATKRLLTIEGERADEQAEAKVSAAIRLGQLVPAQKDAAKRMYLLSATDFEAFVASQPKRLEFGERGVETDESAVTLTASEQTAAKQLGVSDEDMIATKKRERERVGV